MWSVEGGEQGTRIGLFKSQVEVSFFSVITHRTAIFLQSEILFSLFSETWLIFGSLRSCPHQGCTLSTEVQELQVDNEVKDDLKLSQDMYYTITQIK